MPVANIEHTRKAEKVLMVVWFFVAIFALAGLLAIFRPQRQPQPVPYDPTRPYTVFCREFDMEVNARDLERKLNLAHMPAEKLFKEIENGLAAWQARHGFAALEAAERIRATRDAENSADTIITLLVDHSGSMRGQRMLLAAGATMVVCDLLDGLAVKYEVLGYTTAAWRGGQSRAKWHQAGRPAYPGRLNDLLHIVYCTAGQKLNPHDCANMARPGLLKENLDGEAIEWAATRLRKRPETRKCLVVVSDGAPVDDSTLMENGGPYLEQHLRGVIREIAQAADIQLFGVGIGYEVNRYYEQSVTVKTPEDLGTALLGLVERLLLRSRGEQTEL